jgi:hypothetical protein
LKANTDVTNSGKLEAKTGAATLTGTTGNVSNTNDVKAATNIGLTGGKDVTNTGILTAGTDTVLQAGGSIDNQGAITSTTGKAELTADTGKVNNTKAITADTDVTMTGKTDVTNSGKLTATKGAATETAATGKIENTNDVTANTDVTLKANTDVTNSGAIQTGTDALLKAGTDINNTGSINSGHDSKLNAGQDLTNTAPITAGNDVEMTAGRNLVNSGAINAQNNINVLGQNGSVTLDKGGSLDTQNGSIRVETKNTADQTVGKISVNAPITTRTATENGNIDIITNHGDINFTDNVIVNGTGTLTVEAQVGNITGLRHDKDAIQPEIKLQSVNGSVSVYTGKGDVDLYEILAKNTASAGSKDGKLALYKIDGDIVALVTSDIGSNMDIKNTVVGHKLIISGNKVDMGDIKQREGIENMLDVDITGADKGEASDWLNMNFSTVNQGVLFDRIWTKNANINVDTGKLYIDKLTILDRAVFKNKGMITSVYGSAPIRDGNTSIYWYEFDAHNPKGDLTNWLGYGADDNKWMNLYFGLNDKEQTSNGVLLHLDPYHYVYNQRFTGEDHLNFLHDETALDVYQLDYRPMPRLYERYYLYDLTAPAETKPSDIVVAEE